jgi:hypothetical protein
VFLGELLVAMQVNLASIFGTMQPAQVLVGLSALWMARPFRTTV